MTHAPMPAPPPPGARLSLAYARLVQKPTLRLMRNHALLRWLFSVQCRLAAAPPRDLGVRAGSFGHLGGRRVPAHWIRPAGVARDAPVLFHVHGGGFVLGGPDTHRGMVARIAARAGMRAVIPAYRLAPEHPYPAAPDDVEVAWLGLTRRVPPSRIALSGDSAGGTLALSLIHRLNRRGAPLPRAMVLMSPLADLTLTSDAMLADPEADPLIPAAWAERVIDAYVRGADRTDGDVSPLFGDLGRAPPTLIQCSADELLRDDALRLERRLSGAGAEVRLSQFHGVPHVWQMQAGRSAPADLAVEELGAFLSERMGTDRRPRPERTA